MVLNDKVEKYLQDVLKLVTDTMKQKAVDFMTTIRTMSRLDWIDNNFAQLNLLINSIYWVQKVEDNFL
jgi:short-subunit dehydrogenase involved in D-alanine esterification of teichoic acids